MVVGSIYKNQKKDVSGREETCTNPKREEMDALSSGIIAPMLPLFFAFIYHNNILLFFYLIFYFFMG